MQNLKKILFIGRFQPFHSGHLSVIKDINARKDVKEIIIGVGSSQYNKTEENPYNYDFRKKIISLSIENNVSKPVRITAIEDIHDNELWVDHVMDIVGDIDEIYTGNGWVAELFKNKGYAVMPVKFSTDITGTKLREYIKNNNPLWKKFVSEKIIKLLEDAE